MYGLFEEQMWVGSDDNLVDDDDDDERMNFNANEL